MHALGFVVCLLYVFFMSKKFKLNQLKCVFCATFVYASSYLFMLLLFFAITKSFGGQNVVRIFLLIPVFTIIYGLILNLDYKKLLTFFSPVVCFSQFLGKIGCQVVGCCYSNLEVPWGIYNNLVNKTLFPIQLLEGVVSLLIALTLLIYIIKSKYKTQPLLMPIMLVLFGASRFFLEFLRDNNKVLFSKISELSLWSFSMFVVGLLWITVSFFVSRKKE